MILWAYFIRMLIKNKLIKKEHKKYESSDWEGLIPDPQKPDTGFGDPEVQTIGNVSVSICEVNRLNRNRA